MNSTPDLPITQVGIWLSRTGTPAVSPTPALFLDRDGVIIQDTGYVSDPAHVRLLPFAADMVRRANLAGIPVVVATNQSGIARGLFNWDDFAAVQSRITELLAQQGAHLDAVAACPFHPDFTHGYDHRHGVWRKPGPGMLTALAKSLNLDPGRSWMVGDSATDIEAARAAGLAGGVLVGGDDGITQQDDRLKTLAIYDVAGAIDILGLRLSGYSG